MILVALHTVIVLFIDLNSNTMPGGGILSAFAPWEDFIRYKVLSPIGVFVLGGIYVHIHVSNA